VLEKWGSGGEVLAQYSNTPELRVAGFEDSLSAVATLHSLTRSRFGLASEAALQKNAGEGGSTRTILMRLVRAGLVLGDSQG
jgi:hypothetical protein